MKRRSGARFISVLACALGILLTLSSTAFAEDQTEQRYVVRFSEDLGARGQDQLIARQGGKAVRRIDASWTALIATPSALARIAHDPHVLKAEVDGKMRADVTPNDPCFTSCDGMTQWGIKRAGVPGAWDLVPGGSVDIPVAVLDTGVDPTHPEMVGRVTFLVNLTSSPVATDVQGHGTAVAGVIAATGNNGMGIAGIGWATQILSYKVLDDNGNGWISDIAAGIRAAADAGAKVINLSLSGESGSDALQSAVQYASARAVIVAAVGNSGTSTATYPAAYPEVIGVAATNSDDARASFSNFGSWVDLSAPGVSIASTALGGGYGIWNGTSFASPIAAGIASLVWKSSYGVDAASVQQRLLSTTQPLSSLGMGAGLVDASAAVGVIVETVPPPKVSAATWSPWTTIGGIVSSAPDAVSTSPGKLSVLARGADNALWIRESDGTNWTDWSSLGGILSSDPAAVSSGGGVLEVFVRGADGALWQKRRSQGSWSGWGSLGGILSSDPTAASSSANSISVFARGEDRALWQRTRTNGSWSGWQSLGGILSSSPDASSGGGGTIDVFAAGADDALWIRSFDGGSWTSWGSLGGILSSDPAGVSWGPGRVDVFVRGADGALWQKSWSGDWSDWSSLGGALNSNPAAASRGEGLLDILVAGTDNALWLRSLTFS